MSWIFLFLAIVFEVSGATSMKLSAGFSKLIPSISAFLLYTLSIAAFIYALKGINLSFAYAVWAGAGVLAIGAIGILYFKEPVSVLKIVSIILISTGVVTFHLSATTH
jgi:small multidrug resistance pump